MIDIKRLLFLYLAWMPLPAIATLVQPGEDLQAVLDRGEDLELVPGEVYELREVLYYRHDGQAIYTKGAMSPAEYAILRIADPDLTYLIQSNGKSDIRLQNVTLDGSRYRYSTVSDDLGPQPALAHFGGHGGDRQQIIGNLFYATRTWSTLKIHEEGFDNVVEDNIIFGAGTGPRGNGRDEQEKPFSWGDAISCAAERTIIRNNLIIDPTDVGVVVFGAPSTLVEGNVVASVSRESLGGINLVDGIDRYEIEGRDEHYDYRGVVIQNNWIDAFGARIHMALAMGTSIWAPHAHGKILVGASVLNNRITGGAGGYGFVANGIDDFTVLGNISEAQYSGYGDGLNPQLPAPRPGPFIMKADAIGTSQLQVEFVAAEGPVQHLLRCNHGPKNRLGYRVYPYGEYEVQAVVLAAFNEMLARVPTESEAIFWAQWMSETKETSDFLRSALMSTPDFVDLHGFYAQRDLQEFRLELWLGLIERAYSDCLVEGAKIPDMKELYKVAKRHLLSEGIRRSNFLP
jgi:hypothetical protein